MTLKEREPLPGVLGLHNAVLDRQPDATLSVYRQSTPGCGPALRYCGLLGFHAHEAIAQALLHDFPGHGFPGSKLSLALGKSFKPAVRSLCKICIVVSHS